MNILGLMDRLGRTLHLMGRSGPVQYALGGLDIALWDIAGKRAGLPVHRLLGGAGRSSIPAYASLFRINDYSTVRKVCEGLAEEGYTAIKLHEIDPVSTLWAREGAGPNVDLMMDVNCPWDLIEAQEAAAIMLPRRAEMAGGTDLATREPRRADHPCAHPVFRWRRARTARTHFEMQRMAEVPGLDYGAAQRDQDRRDHRVPQGCDGSRAGRQAGRAALRPISGQACWRLCTWRRCSRRWSTWKFSERR